jgi:ribonuclease BN (tRNA processing enzyme)
MLKVILLGTGFPTPQPHRFGSSYLVQIDDEVLMFDCGPGATQRVAASAVRLPQINYLFFTHHHFDHIADYPAFFLTRWDQGAGKAKSLQVFGPHGTERLTRLLFGPEGAFRPDITSRTRHPGSLHMYKLRGGIPPRLPPEFGARDIQSGLVHSGTNYEVSAVPVIHSQPYLDSLAYRVDSPEGSVVITGDTGTCASLVRLAQAADIMIHCVAGSDDVAHSSEMWHAADSPDLWHPMAGPSGAARMAAEARAEKLVLVHLAKCFNDPEVLTEAVSTVQGIFPGKVVVGEDLMEITLSE